MNTQTETRLQALRNGFSPIPNLDKRCFMEGWPTVPIDEATIMRWDRNRRWQATGLRVENGLAVIDVDVNLNEEIATALVRVMADAGVPDTALVRFGKGYKEAWFIRVDEPFGRMHSRRWRMPNAGPDDDTHCIEIFGGASPRQFGAFGAHTVDERTNEPLILYDWEGGRSPANTPLDELPVVPRAALWKVIDDAEALLERAGLVPVEKTTRGENTADRVYDLKPDMTFDLSDGSTVSLDQLRQRVQGGASVRCSAAWLEGKQAKRRDRCLVSRDHSGGVAIWESASGVTHCEESRQPPDMRAMASDALKRLEANPRRSRARLDPQADAFTNASILVDRYAYCPVGAGMVYPIDMAGDDEAGMLRGAFRGLLEPYAEEVVGPRGGITKVNPADVWFGMPERITVAGIRMRPDRPRPLYEEEGQKYINSYTPPVHANPQNGDAGLGLDFIRGLLADEAETEWFLQWLAHKVRYPHIPGPAVVMVATQHGTGRGTLGLLLGRLLGRRYVKELSYSILTGASGQSQYTDWGAKALMVLVTESLDDPSTSGFRQRNAAYERLKEIIDPMPKERQFIPKGKPMFTAVSCASYLIATNHINALQIPREDRRFAVLMNGEPRPAWFLTQLHEWMTRPENIAALDTWLRQVDLSNYSPFVAPLKTEAREAMIEASTSDMDEAFQAALDSFPGQAFVPEQVIDHMRRSMTELPHGWEAIARRMVRSSCIRIGKKDSAGYTVRINGRDYAPYARSMKAAKLFREKHYDVRAHVEMNGGFGSNVVVGNFHR